MASDRELESLKRQVRLFQVLAAFGLVAGIAAIAMTLRQPARARPAKLSLAGKDGNVSLDATGLYFRDAKGVLRAELSLAVGGTHLVLGDPSGRAAVQLTAAADADAPLSALLLGRGDQPHVELKAGRAAELTMGGSGDEPTRVALGYDDSRATLSLASADGKHEAKLSASPGVNEALRLASGEAQQTATITLAPGGSAGLEVQDHASGNGAFLGPARLKLGGTPKERVLVP